jgi:hypothetical protein
MFDPQLWIPLLTLAVAAYGAFLQRRQVQLMAAAKPANRGSTASVWWRSPIIGAMAILTVLAWAPLVIGLLSPKLPQQKIGVASWGGLDLAHGTLPILAVMTDDNRDLKLMGIAYHYDGKTDFSDVKDLQKSALYDVRRGAENILIKADEIFINEAVTRQHVRTNYILLTVPAQLGQPNFSTLRQAFSMGAQMVWSGVGPP